MPGLRRIALASAALLGVVLLPGLAFLGLGDGDPPPRTLLLRAALATSLGLTSFAVALAGLRRGPWLSNLGWRGGPRPPGVVPLGWAVVGMLGLSQGLDLAVHATGWRADSVLAQIDAALAGARGGALLAGFAALAIGPALAEETLFRGALLRALRARMGWLAASFATAFAFGALHLDWVQGTSAGVMGLYLAAVALRFGFWAAVLCHFVNNATAVGLAAGLLDPAELGTAAQLVVAGVGAAGFLGGIHALGQPAPVEPSCPAGRPRDENTEPPLLP